MRNRSNEEAARLLASMAPDDAADLITEVDQDRRLPILNLLPEPQQRKIRSLLSYNPETAGGLMSPDFLSMPAGSTIAGVLEAVRTNSAPPETLNVVFGVDEEGHLVGSASTVRLVQADPSSQLASILEPEPVHMHPDWDLGAIVRTMSDFNLIVVPVLDPDHQRDPRRGDGRRRPGAVAPDGVETRFRSDGGRGVGRGRGAKTRPGR